MAKKLFFLFSEPTWSHNRYKIGSAAARHPGELKTFVQMQYFVLLRALQVDRHYLTPPNPLLDLSHLLPTSTNRSNYNGLQNHLRGIFSLF